MNNSYLQDVIYNVQNFCAQTTKLRNNSAIFSDVVTQKSVTVHVDTNVELGKQLKINLTKMGTEIAPKSNIGQLMTESTL